MKIKFLIGRKTIFLFTTFAIGILFSSSVTNGAVRPLNEHELAKIIGGCECCWEEMPDTVLCSCGEWGPPPPQICEEEQHGEICCFCVNPNKRCAEKKVDGPKADDSCEGSDISYATCSMTTEACCKIAIYRCTWHFVIFGPHTCMCDPKDETRNQGTRDVCTIGSVLCD